MSFDVRAMYTVDIDREPWPADRVGGKADGLHRLSRAGFRVPPGFCVTTEAFERVVPRLALEADDLEQLRERIRDGELPGDIEGDVRDRLDRLDAERWAVRSSALEEDEQVQSFAGQQRTELDLRRPSEVLAAIRRVWADLYDVDVLLYRERLRVDGLPRPMAVVVQAMVEARVGGVMFTESPLDDADRRMLVTASSTPREVVEGRGGASYYVDRDTCRLDRYVPPAEDTPEEDETPAGTTPGPLTGAQLRELVETAERLEATFGSPRDVEWAYGPDGELHLLQARPITGSSRGGEAPDDTESSVWTNANVGEALPGVATPLTWSIIGAFSRRGFERAFGTLGLSVPEDYELVGSFRGRVYLNLTQFVSIASSIPVLEPDVLFEMAGGGGLELVRETAARHSPVEFLLRLPVTLPRIALSQLAMPLVVPFWSRWFDDRIDSFFERDLSEQPREALRAELDRIDWLFDRNGLITLTCSSNFLMSYVAMKHWLEWFGTDEAREREREWVRALDVPSTEPGLKLLELSRRARDSETLRRLIEETPSEETLEALDARRERDDDVEAFLSELETFLEEHGHRAPREAELSTPRWREESGFVFDVVESYLDAPEMPSPESYRDEWQQVRDRVDDWIEEAFGRAPGACFRLVLAWARETAELRERMRTRVVESLDLYRAFALECGRRLADEGALREAEDVFLLRYDEIRRWLDGELAARELPLRVLVRDALVEALRDLPDPPNTFVHRNGEMLPVEADDTDEEGRTERPADVACVLEGLPGNRGTATGPARVIEDPESGETVRAGEILVAPYTDVGWTPLFLTASGVVMGLGGPLSHACIVAREFGLPTVVNARGALDCIETGDRVTVDGDRGLVYVHTS